MDNAEGQRMTRIARIMREQNVSYDSARWVADAEIRFEERRAERALTVEGDK